MKYTMDLPAIHQVLVDVAGDGESLKASVDATADAAVAVAASFGDVAEVGAAFDGFWAARSDVGNRLSSVLFRKATGISHAAEAFRAGDSTMDADAGDAMTMIGNTRPDQGDQQLPVAHNLMLLLKFPTADSTFPGFGNRPGS